MHKGGYRVLTKNRVISIESPPSEWTRLGKIMNRGELGDFDCCVTGDPCIVWDENRRCYHMFYFAQSKEDGIEHNRNGHAIVQNPILDNIHKWQKLGEVKFTNYEEMLGKETHKPWILMDPFRPNTAVKWRGFYWMFTASVSNGRKFLQAAYCDSLDGPWTIDPSLNVFPGEEGTPDELHVDTPTAYYFEKEKKILVFYMGYPLKAQKDTAWTPYGSRSMTVEIDTESGEVKKTGSALLPFERTWIAGYIGGLQLIKADNKGWFALINASPTPPCSVDEDSDIREPAPSLGGFIYTPKEYPDSGWSPMDDPIEYEESIPQSARDKGEGVNMWRHHLLFLPEGKVVCLYNSGNYGNEQMFGKMSDYSIQCCE